jgi:hypothetical protein
MSAPSGHVGGGTLRSLLAYRARPGCRLQRLMAPMQPGFKIPNPTDVTRDHAFPKSQGWRLDDFEGANRVVCCYGCNQDKRASNIVDWHIRLAVGGNPRAPHVMAIIRRLWVAMECNAFVPANIRAKLNLARNGLHIPADKHGAMQAAQQAAQRAKNGKATRTANHGQASGDPVAS